MKADVKRVRDFFFFLCSGVIVDMRGVDASMFGRARDGIYYQLF